MEIQACCHEGCGCLFGVEFHHGQRLRNDKTAFYCPNGHRQLFTGKSKDALIQEAKDETARERARHDQTKAALEHTDDRRHLRAGEEVNQEDSCSREQT